MALQLGALRDALIDAGAKPEKADKAAEEMAGYEHRLGGIDARLAVIDARLSSVDSRLGLLTWAVGLNVTLTLATLAKLLISH